MKKFRFLSPMVIAVAPTAAGAAWLALALPALADDAAGVNCKGGYATNNEDYRDDMNDICEEWQGALGAAQSGGLGGSADPQPGGTSPGPGPSTDVGPVGDPRSPKPRPRVDTPPPGGPPFPTGSPPVSGGATPGITWEQFQRSCLRYQSGYAGMTGPAAQATCDQLATKYRLSPTSAAAGFVALIPDITRRDVVSRGQSARYSAGLSVGQTYVLSLTGITGAAALKVYDDAGLKQPTTCLSPKNLANSTYMQAADCTFVATGSTVYATVTGTSFSTAALSKYRYNIRLSPHSPGSAANEGSVDSPKSIAANRPHGGTVGPARGDSSYYVLNTTGGGELVVSLTGLTGNQGMDLFIYENPQFKNWLYNKPYCYTAELITYPESCVLPADRTYYVEVRNQADGIGGPFTLTVDSLQAVENPPTTPKMALPQAAPPAKTKSGAAAPPPPAGVPPAVAPKIAPAAQLP